MKVNTNFKDFYDCAFAHDGDKFVQYNRFTKIFPYNGPTVLTGYFKSNILNYECERFYVGFCGRILHCIKIKHNDKNNFFYSYDKFVEFNNTIINKKDFDYIFGEKKKEYNKKYFESKQCINYIETFFNPKNENKKEFEKIPQVPIYIIELAEGYETRWRRNVQIIHNPRLNKIDFFKVYDPYTCYQEISMYMANQASPEKEIPKISDELMAESKGFDKYSFRKDPSVKKDKK